MTSLNQDEEEVSVIEDLRRETVELEVCLDTMLVAACKVLMLDGNSREGGHHRGSTDEEGSSGGMLYPLSSPMVIMLGIESNFAS